MIMHRPPTDHEEWLEENEKPKKPKTPPPEGESPPKNDKLSGARERFEALNQDIQDFG